MHFWVLFSPRTGKRIFHDWMTKLDLLIIGSGYAEIFLGMMVELAILDKIGIVRVLRLGRIVRLMQLLRKNRSLKELRKLVTMLATCFRTLLWSFLFCFLVMTGWAMLPGPDSGSCKFSGFGCLSINCKRDLVAS